jgi:type II secretory pathway component PulK
VSARPPEKRRRGSTLALVLWTLVVAGGLSLAVSSRTRSAVSVASNARAQVVARYAAESGIIFAVQVIEDSLGTIADSSTRSDFLNALAKPPFAFAQPALEGAQVQVAVEDVNAKLDLNYADADDVARLLSELGDAAAARRTATAIRAHIGTGVTPASPDESFPIGQQRGTSRARAAAGARYLTSLDELSTITDVNHELLERAAPYLSVDGDGMTNRTSAPEIVLHAATGALVDAPNRLLLVSRGWLEGTSLTHEIQAVYAVQGNQLALVRWRERTR